MKPIRFYRITAVFMSILFLLAGCAKSAAEQLKEQLELGQNYLLEMNYEGAVVAFSKAIELDPKSWEAYEGLTNVYIAQGQYDEAYVVFSQAEETVTDENALEELRTEIPRKITETLLTGWSGGDDWQTVYDSIVSEENEEMLLGLTEPVIVADEDGQGMGIYISSSGNICLYIGSYEDGMRSGYGIMGFDLGMERGFGQHFKVMYEGQWANDYPNGEGLYTNLFLGEDGLEEVYIQGTYMDGWENGQMTRTDVYEGEASTETYTAVDGYIEGRERRSGFSLAWKE